MSRKMSIALALIVVAEACGQSPQLRPRVIMPGEGVGSSFWLLAPKIAIVEVERAKWLEPDLEMTPGKLMLRLVAVDARVENVIQGEIPEDLVRFYFFTNSLTSDGGYSTPRMWFEPGERYVVFLREDGGYLRTMADLTGPNIRIPSGRHQKLPVSSDASQMGDPAVTIATAALTPAADHVEGFANSIQDTFNRLLLITTPSRLARLLRPLLTNPDRETSERACLALSINFSYRDPCFAKLLDSADPVVKQQASIWASRKRGGEQRLLSLLRDDPISLSISGTVGDLAGDLELFIFDQDVAVRHQACLALHRLFPLREFPNCADLINASEKFPRPHR